MDWDALRITMQVALTSVIITTIVGIPLAWWLARARFVGRDFVSAAVLAPMVLPPTVLGYYLLQIAGRRSALGAWLESSIDFGFAFHWTGAVLAAFVVSLPFLIRTSQAGFESIDAVYEEAARTLGRSEIAVFLLIAIPLAKKSIFAGIALALARSLGEFGATLMIAGNMPGKTQTLSVAIFDAVQSGRTDDAQVLAISLTLISIGLLVAVGSGRRTGYR